MEQFSTTLLLRTVQQYTDEYTAAILSAKPVLFIQL